MEDNKVPDQPHTTHRRYPVLLEVLALLAILAVAVILRFYRLIDFPPGFHYDEAIDLKIALDVFGGTRPLYVAEGWGREALYYYLVAPMLRLVSYNPLALRATAALCGMGVIIAAYGLARRWQGKTTAWLTAAWLAVAMWPVWAARFGVRHISLALLLGLSAWAFWWAFERTNDQNRGAKLESTSAPFDSHPSTGTHRSLTTGLPFLLAGLLLGLTAYTYQPARFIPLLFAGFGVYLVLFHRRLPWANKRGWLIWGGSAALVVLPLAIILSRAIPVEAGERAFSIEPLTELWAGNPRPLLDNVVATAGAFSVRGDPLKSYNLPGRPLFVPRWTGAFFYAGLALALWRWRRPPYAFALLWLAVALLPTVVTVSAPNFNRMVAAQFPVYFLAALAAAEGIRAGAARAQWAGAALALLVAVALGWTAYATVRDLFHVWPEQYADTHTLNREIAAVALYLEQSDDERPVVVSSRDIEDEDPYIVRVSLDRLSDRRWVDTSQALALPANVDEARLIVTAERWIDPLLSEWVGADTPATNGVDRAQEHDEFTIFSLSAIDWPTLGTPALTLPSDSSAPDPRYPVPFCDCSADQPVVPALWLTGASLGEAHPGQELSLLTAWETNGARFSSLAMFVHLLDAGGAIVAQDDGLGYPPHTWQPGDRFLQLARLPLPPDLPPGDYTMQFGLYDRADGRRWPILNSADQPVADRILLPAEAGN